MDKKIIRFGILGCGMIARFHADAIDSLENAQLLGAASANPASAKAFAESRGIQAYESYEAMLRDPEIDAVCICTPSGCHGENAIQALNAKKHVVLEKPMAFTAEECRKIDETAKENGCVLTVICQLRFSEDVQRIRRLLAENAFGKLVFCDLYMKYWRNPAYYSSSNWKGTKKFDGGGALMNQGIHGVDLLLYLVGDAKVLCAKNKTHFHDIEVEDLSVAMLEFENGAMGVIEASTCSNPGFERRLEITGTEGSAVLVENRIKKLILKGEDCTGTTEAKVSGTASDPAAMDFALHALQISNFIKAIYGEAELVMSAKEGGRAVALIDTIYNF